MALSTCPQEGCVVVHRFWRLGIIIFDQYHSSSVRSRGSIFVHIPILHKPHETFSARALGGMRRRMGRFQPAPKTESVSSSRVPGAGTHVQAGVPASRSGRVPSTRAPSRPAREQPQGHTDPEPIALRSDHAECCAIALRRRSKPTGKACVRGSG